MTQQSIPREVFDSVHALCEDISTPISLSVAILMKYGEWDQLAVKRLDPMQYLSSDSYWRDASAISVLRKVEDLPTSFDREAKAVESFFACEKACYRTNERLSPYIVWHSLDLPRSSDDTCVEGVGAFIASTRKYVAKILGKPPAELRGRFGPGSTYGDRGQLTTIPDKMSSRPTLTSSAMGFLFPWIDTAWAKACSSDGRAPLFVPGNRFTTVPKDATKFRGIAIEPSINLFYQLGLGRAIRERLKRSGIDLRDGQDIHRQVACEASRRGHMSTLDLSNASDTVCKNLVKLLLPSAWYELLDSLRSPTTTVDGKVVRLEKFSSMGNGFTFELETLVFLGLCCACMEACAVPPDIGVNVFVYGDDIIVPTECSRVVISALRFFGLTTNSEKSFSSGPFRESCGGDYFNGVDVRPYFLKEFPSEPQQLIAMANGLRRLGNPIHPACHRPHTVRRAWFRILDAIPSDVRRLRGPQDLGDLVIHDDSERWQTRWRSGIRYIGCYRPARFTRVGWEHFKPDVQLATFLYGSGDERGGDHPVRGVMPRDPVTGYKRGWVPWS